MDDVVDRYLSGESVIAIAASRGVTRQAVAEMLRRRGVTLRPVGKLNEAQKIEAAARYQSGETGAALARDFNLSEPAIRALLVRRGVILRPGKKVNHAAFDDASEESAYWTGFLFADGCIHKRSPGGQHEVSVGLAYRDVLHLECFRNLLGSDHKIIASSKGPDGRPTACQLRFRSDRIANYLLTAGKYSSPIDLKLTQSRHFWRGVVDGDGSIGIYSGKPQFRVVGNRELLDTFRSYLRERVVTGVSVRPHKGIFQLGTTSRPAAEIISLLYSGAKVSLARKAMQAAAVTDVARDYS